MLPDSQQHSIKPSTSTNSFEEEPPQNEQDEYELDPSLKMLEEDQGGAYDAKRGMYRESIGSFKGLEVDKKAKLMVKSHT